MEYLPALIFIILIVLLCCLNKIYELSIINTYEEYDNLYKGGYEQDNKIIHSGYLKYFKEMSNYTRNCSIRGGNSGKTLLKTHSWYNFDNWEELENDKFAWMQYKIDRKKARYNFLFDWSDIIKELSPIVNKDNIEYIGIIRARPDKKTLYVHEMESTVNSNISNKSYLYTISDKFVKKYIKIPGYFLFHTHPKNGDAMPTDSDIYMSLLHSLTQYFIGEVVVGSYGIIIYYLNDKRYNDIIKQGGLLAFYTFCYDVIMSWNSVNSMESIRLDDRLLLLEKFGLTMILIPSALYISLNQFKQIKPEILFDRFIKTKYELLDIIKEIIKREEYKELKNKNRLK
jgi:hypothetical protein